MKTQKEIQTLQEKITDPDHIQAIDKLIPTAWAEACRKNKTGRANMDRLFHRAMNRMAREEGLRSI